MFTSNNEASDINTLIRKVLLDIQTQGEEHISRRDRPKREEPVKELLNCQLLLTSPRNRVFRSLANPAIFNPGLAVARFFYLLSGSDRLENIEAYTRGANWVSDDGIAIVGNSYGHRIFYQLPGINQFESARNLIVARPNTKRATIVLYGPYDCGRDSQDVPCVLSLGFSPREDILHTTVMMRANNVFRLTCYNVFELSLLAEFMASYVHLELGTYAHFSVSMQLRGNDIQSSVGVATETVDSPSMDPMPQVNPSTRGRLVHEESTIRALVPTSSQQGFKDLVSQIKDGYEPYWVDLLMTVALQRYFMTHTPQEVISLLGMMSLPDTMLLSTEWCRFFELHIL